MSYWDIKKEVDKLIKVFKKVKIKHRKLHWQEQDEFIRRGSNNKKKGD